MWADISALRLCWFLDISWRSSVPRSKTSYASLLKIMVRRKGNWSGWTTYFSRPFPAITDWTCISGHSFWIAWTSLFWFPSHLTTPDLGNSFRYLFMSSFHWGSSIFCCSLSSRGLLRLFFLVFSSVVFFMRLGELSSNLSASSSERTGRHSWSIINIGATTCECFGRMITSASFLRKNPWVKGSKTWHLYVLALIGTVSSNWDMFMVMLTETTVHALEHFFWGRLNTRSLLHGFLGDTDAWDQSDTGRNMLAFVLLHISCISFWCHIPEGPGFSNWKWSPRSNCILQTREQKVSCSRDLSWLSWIRQKDDTPLIWLKRFQGHHGAHSGAIHTCLGFQRKTLLQQLQLTLKSS